MEVDKIKLMRRRIDRMLQGVREKRRFGDAVHSVDDPTVDCEYIIKNVKSPEDYEDNVLSVVKEIWALKDYIGKALKKIGGREKEVETFVNKNYELTLCADMANASKHDGFDRKKRSSGFGRPFLRCSRARMITGKNPNMEIMFEANRVTQTFKNPDEVHYSIDVLDESGSIIGDAEEIMAKAVSQWDIFIVALKTAPGTQRAAERMP